MPEQIEGGREYNHNDKDGTYATEPAKELTLFNRFEGYLIVILILAIVVTVILLL